MTNAVRRMDNEPFFVDQAVTTVADRQTGEPLFRLEKFRAHYDTDASVGEIAAKEFPSPAWQVSVLTHLLRFTSLATGWDSYSGLPLRGDAGLFAVRILNGIMGSDTPIPAVVPSSTGGVQLEWHEKEVDLEIHVAAPYDCEVWYENHRTGQQRSWELTNNFSDLAGPISELGSR